MANTILRSSHHESILHFILGLFSLLLLINEGGAYEFKVGGPNGWRGPTDSGAVNYNQWAENHRFQIGDTLLFSYQGDKDSVLYVTKDDYSNCSTANPIDKFTDGYSVFKFNHSGPYYFISGVQDNCLKNEKMVVVVLADRSNRTSGPAASPAPSGSTEASTPSPPPSGSTEMVPPSPAPANEGATSPPAGSVEINPSPAPTTEHNPPPSSASSIIASFISSIGVSWLISSFCCSLIPW